MDIEDLKKFKMPTSGQLDERTSFGKPSISFTQGNLMEKDSLNDRTDLAETFNNIAPNFEISDHTASELFDRENSMMSHHTPVKTIKFKKVPKNTSKPKLVKEKRKPSAIRGKSKEPKQA